MAFLLTIEGVSQSGEPNEPWPGFARDPQHAATADAPGQPLTRIRWQARVDRHPLFSGDELLIHYGSPIITAANTVILAVKSGKTGHFFVEARRGIDGQVLWRVHSNYRLPPHDWILSFSPALSPNGTVWTPGSGGTLFKRTNADASGGSRGQPIAFYGTADYLSNPEAYRKKVFINTPITSDASGNLYFGFQVTGPTPTNLESGIARLSVDGGGSWVSASSAAGDSSIRKVAHNSAPALSPDGQTLYVAVNDGDGSGEATGYLLALDSSTLTTTHKVRLIDPQSGQDADIFDDATASPSVGPDGDVYFGVLENPLGSHNARGWLLHFDAALSAKGYPGSFGWDDTASVVPASMVPAYGGSSSYLLMTKYNNYAEWGGDGINRIAVLDPNAPMVDPISAVTVMNEVLTAVGPTPDEDDRPMFPNAVREWCINTAAVDPQTKSIFANSEDGVLYRWDMTTGLFSQSIVLTPGFGEAYTPTVVGPDGTVYAINDATLFAVGQ